MDDKTAATMANPLTLSFVEADDLRMKMKQFAITFLAVLLAAGLALLAYDFFIVKPRELAMAEAAQVNLKDARSQAQNIADNLEHSVNQSISNANDKLNAQSDNMSKRGLANDALMRGSIFKTALAESFMTNGHWPKNNTETGLAQPESYAGGAVSSIAVSGKGSIVITLNDKLEAGAKIKLIPDVNPQSYVVNWRCTTEGSETLKHNLLACNQ